MPKWLVFSHDAEDSPFSVEEAPNRSSEEFDYFLTRHSDDEIIELTPGNIKGILVCIAAAV